MDKKILEKINLINENLGGKHPCNDSLINGNLGVAYYNLHLYRVFKKKYYKDHVLKYVDQCLENRLSGRPTLCGISLTSGVAGLGYLLNELDRDPSFQLSFTAELTMLDKILLEASLDEIQKDRIDFLHGALGVLYYYCQRETGRITTRSIEVLVSAIIEKAVKTGTGIWFKNQHIPTRNARIDMGLAHGLCGVLLILLKCLAKTDRRQRIQRIVYEGLAFIWETRRIIGLEKVGQTIFPSFIDPATMTGKYTSRLAWCYGDLNEALLFSRAGYLLGNQALINISNAIGRETIIRADEHTTLITDTHFCHGSSGLAQLYYILEQETNINLYKSSGKYWINKTMSMLDRDLDNGFYKDKEYDLLEGLSGVSLSLLSYHSKGYVSNWSNLFLL